MPLWRVLTRKAKVCGVKTVEMDTNTVASTCQGELKVPGDETMS